MIRLIWLLISLFSWIIVWTTMPRLPTWVVWMLIFISVTCYLFGWVIHKRNWLIHFFTGMMWMSVWIAYKVMVLWENISFPLSIQPATIGKGVLILGLIKTIFLTFANYRVSLNFIQRRGNIDKEQLVRLHPTMDDQWKRLGWSFKRFFKRQTKEEQQEIVLTLGEEVPFKD